MICTYCERTPIEVNGRVKHVVTSKRILPQGSPASPMITNIICRKLDKRLHGLATRYGMTYSRYADDMSFSLIEQKDINIGQFWGMVNKIVSEEGFEIHKQKTRFLRKNNQQKITGIIINHTEIGLPKKWIKRYRAAIHNTNRLLEEKQKISESKIYEIAGMTSWVKSVNAERYATLITAAQQLITNAMEEISKK
jgi:RNA-directed DNA polymerase